MNYFRSMKFAKIHNKGQARIFENKYLEALTKSHPLVIWGVYIPLLSFFIYYSYSNLQLGLSTILLLFLSGIVFWSLFEYLAHRYIFHWMGDNPKMQQVAYIMHGNHHHYPRDKQRLFMPLVPSLMISSSLLALFYLLLKEKAFSFFTGFMSGYLLYASMHYAIHAWNPPYKWMKPLWRNHHLHHYKDEHKGFGVSSTIWDHVFGTMFDLKKEKEDKEKIKELMFERK